MSNRKIIMLVIGAVVFGIIFFFYSKQLKEQEQEIALVLGYDQETFLTEGGYTAARDYADEIFLELYCNTEGIVYQYAFADNGIDIPHRDLLAAIMITSPTENHLYLEYQIPNVSNVKDENGLPTDEWQYTGTYNYALMDLRNIERHGVSNYSCSDFSIVDDDVRKVLEKALDTNGEKLELDGLQKKAIDYGVLYNIDEDLAKSIATREKNRISGFLLDQQVANAAEYRFSTIASEDGGITVSSNQASVIDKTETTHTPSAPGSAVEVDENGDVVPAEQERFWTGGVTVGSPEQQQNQPTPEENEMVNGVDVSVQQTEEESEPAAEPTEEPVPTVYQSFTPRAGE